MLELINLRQENSKTLDLGNGKRGLEVSMGAVHYKDDYSSKTEAWKDIDLTWIGNRITKAPYELTLDGQKITIRDKKSGEVSTIELLEIKPPGMKFEIVPENTRVSFRHILPSEKIPLEAKFKITGNGLITTKAFDDDGEIVLDTAVVGDVLTEKLSSIVDKQTGVVRPARGNIRIDPTWQVGASTDDCLYAPADGTWATTTVRFSMGYIDVSETNRSSAARFLNITIPAGSTIDGANLVLTCRSATSSVVINSRLRAEANVNPATFSTAANFLARTWTSDATHVHWNAIAAWTSDVAYTSPEIKAVIQEVIGLPGWASGNPMVVLWDDFQNLSDQEDAHYREAYSYDSSTTKAPKLYIEYTSGTTYYGTATLSGVGTLSGIGRRIVTGIVTFSGSGSLSAMLRKINRRYGTKVPNETSIITTKPPGAGRYG